MNESINADCNEPNRMRTVNFGNKRKLVFQKISPNEFAVKLYYRSKESRSYLFTMKNALEEDKPFDLHSIWQDIKGRMKEDDKMKKWMKRIKFYLTLVSKSQNVDNNMKRILDREGITYSYDEFPRLKKLALRIYPAIPDIDHIQEKAYEKDMSLNPKDIAKICWTIHAFDHTIQELIEGKAIY
jgi:hypothetical protein